MKRIRTIFVSLVILLVSLTMATGAVAFTPLQPVVGTDSAYNSLEGSGYGADLNVDGDLEYGTQGDPDDGLDWNQDPFSLGDKGDRIDDSHVPLSWVTGSGSLSVDQILYLFSLVNMLAP